MTPITHDEETKQYDITTTAQVERTYRVRGTDEEQAQRRLRAWIRDSDAIAPGIVVALPGKVVDSTPQKIKTTALAGEPAAPPAE